MRKSSTHKSQSFSFALKPHALARGIILNCKQEEQNSVKAHINWSLKWRGRVPVMCTLQDGHFAGPASISLARRPSFILSCPMTDALLQSLLPNDRRPALIYLARRPASISLAQRPASISLTQRPASISLSRCPASISLARCPASISLTQCPLSNALQGLAPHRQWRREEGGRSVFQDIFVLLVFCEEIRIFTIF